MRRVDAAHLILMCIALALAYLVPFELLLLSYVVLGPAPGAATRRRSFFQFS